MDKKLVLAFILLAATAYAAECGSAPINMEWCAVTQDTTFDPGVYNIPQGIYFDSDVTLDCNGATLLGNRSDGFTAYALNAYIENNIVVQNCNITNYHGGLDFDRTSGNTIQDNIFTNMSWGVSLGRSDYSSVFSNNFSSISSTVILFWGNPSNTFVGNNIAYLNHIEGADTAFLISSHKNTVTQNTGNDISQEAVTSFGSENNTVTHNTFLNGGRWGFRMGWFHHGIIAGNYIEFRSDEAVSFINSRNNTIENNTFKRIRQSSFIPQSELEIVNSTNNTIRNNVVIGNASIGLKLQDNSSNNLIYNNIFNNTLGIVADNANNSFNVTKTFGSNIVGGPYIGGNYWSNYVGVDNNGDGIGDTPYISSNATDFLPLFLVTPCTNGIMDNGEIGIDCGGSCGACPACTPIVRNGDSEDKIDVVFMMAQDYFENWGQFRTDIFHQINNSFFADPILNNSKDKFNFWYLNRTATVGVDISNNNCKWFAPDNWKNDCPSSSVGAIMHLESCRDYSQGDVFSAENYSVGTFLHEAGHGVFGLTDQYDDSFSGCGTPYWEANPFPNVYESETSCQLKSMVPGMCREFTSCAGGWWKADSDFAIMNGCDGNGYPLITCPWGLDSEQRVQWVLDQYPSGSPFGMSMATQAESTIEEPKVIVVNFNYNGSIEVLDIAVEQGVAPEHVINWSGFNFITSNSAEQILEQFSIDNPREKHFIEPPFTVELLNESNFTLVFSFEENIKNLSIYDSQSLLAIVDLTPTIVSYCQNNTNDAQCASYDSENDGLPDLYELNNSCLDPAVKDANFDWDDDKLISNVANITLTNSDEYNAGTNPCVNDTDHDGWYDSYEMYIGTSPIKSCGNDGWPADLFDSTGGPLSTDVNIQDLTAFLVPVRHINTKVGDPNYDKRFDLLPGSGGALSNDINIQDLVALLVGVTAYPPMLNGERAFNNNCPP